MLHELKTQARVVCTIYALFIFKMNQRKDDTDNMRLCSSFIMAEERNMWGIAEKIRNVGARLERMQSGNEQRQTSTTVMRVKCRHFLSTNGGEKSCGEPREICTAHTHG